MQITPAGFSFNICATVFIGFLPVESHRSNVEPPATRSDSDAHPCDVVQYYAYCRRSSYRTMLAPTVLLLARANLLYPGRTA
jgi:hypothetical protein